MRGSKDAMVRPKAGGVAKKWVGPLERRGNIAERSEKRETSTTHMRGSKGAKVRPKTGGMAQKGVGP